MDPHTTETLIAAEKQARDDMKTAETARSNAADRRSLAIADLVDVLGPTETARRIGVSLTVVQKSRDRAKLVRALQAAGRAPAEETTDA